MAPNILIFENSIPHLNQLVGILDGLGHSRVTACKSYEEAMAAIDENAFDIALLGIQLEGEKTGIDVGLAIREKSSMPIVYTTLDVTEADYERAKLTLPSQFLDKEPSPLKLRQAIELSLLKNDSSDQPQTLPSLASIEPKTLFSGDLSNGFFLRKGKQFKKIHLQDLDFVESDRNYSILKTETDQTYVIVMLLSELEAILKPYGFMRTHRRFLVNWAKVSSVNFADNIINVNDKEISIGKSYRNDVFERLCKLPS